MLRALAPADGREEIRPVTGLVGIVSIGSPRKLLQVAVASILVFTSSLAFAQDDPELVAEGRRLYAERSCDGCHATTGSEPRSAPDLSAVGRRYSLSYLTYWLAANPYRGSAHMPKIELTEGELSALAAYLASLRGF